MKALLITFAVFVLLRVLFERKYRNHKLRGIAAAIADEFGTLPLVVGILLGGFVLLYAISLVFGPIPQIHEW